MIRLMKKVGRIMDKEINKKIMIKIIEITINILFWLFIIYTLITNFDTNYLVDTFDFISSYDPNILLFIITMLAKIILDLILKIPLTFILLIMYIFYTVYRKKYKKKETYIINEFNMQERKKELSEIIKDCSPLVLSYIKNYKLTDKALTSARIIINQKQERNEKLTLNEKYIVNCDTHKTKIDQDRLEREVVKDCKNKKLISKRKFFTKKGIIFLTFWIILMIISFVSNLTWEKMNVEGAIFEIYLQLLAALLNIIPFGVIPLIGLVYFIPYILENSKNYLYKTPKAKTINTKLSSLKYFIICLPYMDRKYEKEIKDWPEFEAYETLFKN